MCLGFLPGLWHLLATCSPLPVHVSHRERHQQRLNGISEPFPEAEAWEQPSSHQPRPGEGWAAKPLLSESSGRRYRNGSKDISLKPPMTCSSSSEPEPTPCLPFQIGCLGPNRRPPVCLLCQEAVTEWLVPSSGCRQQRLCSRSPQHLAGVHERDAVTMGPGT